MKIESKNPEAATSTRSPTRTPVFSRIFLTGASSGLGRALALEAALPGVTLGILARRKDRLESLACELQLKGANTVLYTGDVRDKAFMEWAGKDFWEHVGSPDCLIANAGIRGPLHAGLNDRQEDEIMETNFHGARNTILPFLPEMMRNRNGTILVISSLAAFLALPETGGYCASKAALNMWCGSLRYELKPFGITLTTVNPGFIRTEMTRDNPYPMPFVLEADTAARRILQAARRKKSVYSFPPGLSWPLRLMGLLPTPLRETLLRIAIRQKHSSRL
ncbi:MAG: SDR family NAD(P)-dependent oxidoreductase [Nitrospirae bacterium]|jgi:hypothetical protein|nr:SDR family NAD(P)-dependent oxidoreductase [Nitrospirota bacterium]